MKRKRATNLEITKKVEEFINNLQVFADYYIDEVNNVILDHLEELYREDAIHYLLNEFIRKNELLQYFNKNYLLIAYEQGVDVDRNDFEGKEVSELRDILYKLCYKRFQEREGKSENE